MVVLACAVQTEGQVQCIFMLWVDMHACEHNAPALSVTACAPSYYSLALAVLSSILPRP